MRFEFTDKEFYNARFGSGLVVHRVISETRIDLVDNSKLIIAMTVCGQDTHVGHSRFHKIDKEVTCKKCLRKTIK